MARELAKLPRHKNPLLNPAAHDALPADLKPHVAAIAAHPELAAVATGSSGGPMPGSSPSGGTGSSFQNQPDAVMPSQALFKRLPNVRHQVCGMPGVVFAAAATSPGTFSPQVRFKPNRLVIPSGTLAGTTISNMLVGVKPQYAAASVESFDFFEEMSTGGLWDMDVCEIGQKITFNITVTGATTVFAALIGEMLDGRAYPMLRSPIKRIAATTGGTVAAGASFTFNIAPQVRFKARKLLADDVTAKFFNLTAFTVGITPQFISGDPVPLSAFTEVAQDVWLDCDEAYVGNLISLTVTNTDAAVHALNVSFLGDVNPADLVAQYG
jgi:hypothetical protein